MKITSVDDKNDLFLVEDFYPENILNKIKINELLTSENLQDVNNGNSVGTRRSVRRTVLNNELIQFTESVLPQLSENIGVKLSGCTVNLWIDGPGFYMGIHEDNAAIQVSLQIYLTDDDISLGTKFYHEFNHDHTKASLRYDFPYRLNCGYIMISKPGQWHGFPVKLKDNQQRLTTYTYLYKV
jgi:hypothetical protein